MDAATISNTSPTSVSSNKCTSCERTYTTKRSLLRYRRSSIKCFSGARPIVRHLCPYCQDTFARPDNVQKHIRRAHLSLQEALSSPTSGALNACTSDTGRIIFPQSQESSPGSTAGSLALPSTPDAQKLLLSHHHVSCWTDWSVEASIDTNSATPDRNTSSGDIDTWYQDKYIFGLHDIFTEYNTGGSLGNADQQWFCHDPILRPPSPRSCAGSMTQDFRNVVNSVTASENVPGGLSAHAPQGAVCLAAEQDQSPGTQTLPQKYTSLSTAHSTVSATEVGPGQVHFHQNEEPYPSLDPTYLQSMALPEAASAGSWPDVHLLLGFGTPAHAASMLTVAEAGSSTEMDLYLDGAHGSRLGSTQLGLGLRAAAFDHLQENAMNNNCMIPWDLSDRCPTCDAMHKEHESDSGIHQL